MFLLLPIHIAYHGDAAEYTDISGIFHQSAAIEFVGDPGPEDCCESEFRFKHSLLRIPSSSTPWDETTKIEYMNTIDAILYINLDSREDRKRSILNEIETIGFPTSRIHRIPAVYDAVCGHLGCGLSHVAALDLALQHGWKRILVLEDDFHFSATNSELDQFIQDADALQWDVLLLAKGHISIQEKRGNLHRVKGCSTTSGYIVQQHYYTVLQNNFKESIACMKQQVDRHIKNCLDPYVTIGNDTEMISIPQGVRLRYGHPDKGWCERTVYTLSFVASNEYFKEDPAPGIRKHVEYADVCLGYEGDTIQVPVLPYVPKETRIRYGHPNTYWVEKIIYDSEIISPKEYFKEDPAPGILKYVQIYDPTKQTFKMPKLVHGVTAIDQHWSALQRRDRFYIRDPVIGHQGGFGSDTG